MFLRALGAGLAIERRTRDSKSTAFTLAGILAGIRRAVRGPGPNASQVAGADMGGPVQTER